MKKQLTLLFLIFSILIFSHCQNNLVQAEKSLNGEWNVTSINIQKGLFSNNTFQETESFNEPGQLGTFNFNEDNVSFKFKLADLSYEDDTSWQLKYEKINSGFVRVPDYKLSLGNGFLFDVSFEDATKNSEKNANKVTLTQIPNEGDTELLILDLDKVQ